MNTTKPLEEKIEALLNENSQLLIKKSVNEEIETLLKENSQILIDIGHLVSVTKELNYADRTSLDAILNSVLAIHAKIRVELERIEKLKQMH